MSDAKAMTDELDRDIAWLLDNPGGSMGSTYHDSGSCWRLIDRMRITISDRDAAIKVLADWALALDEDDCAGKGASMRRVLDTAEAVGANPTARAAIEKARNAAHGKERA